MNKKKVLSIFLTLSMTFGMCTAFADNTATSEGTEASVEESAEIMISANADEYLKPYLADIVNGASLNTNGRVGSITNNSYIRYANVDFGESGFSALQFDYGVDDSWGGGDVRVYIDSLDSTPIAEFILRSTGSFTTKKSLNTDLTTTITGIHDVYVKFFKQAACDFWGIQFKGGSSVSAGGVNIPNGISELSNADTAIKLYSLGVLDAAEGFSADKNVTNAQVLAAARRISSQFTISDAAFSEKYGFNANDDATRESILKIFALTAGYGEIENYGTLNVFTHTKLINNHITQKEFINCLNDFLAQKVMEVSYDVYPTYKLSDKTVMNECMGLYEDEGVVKSTARTSLNGMSYINEVLIGDTLYIKNDVDTESMFGYNVKVYYSKSDEGGYELKLLIPYKNSELELTSDDVVRRDELTVSYEISGKKYKAKLDEKFALIYNGIFTPTFDNKIFTTFNGTVKLIDSNSDGKYDFIIMNDVVDVIVTRVTSDNVIYGESADKNWSLDLDEKEYTILSSSGSVLAENEIKSISAGTVISVGKAEIDGETIYSITVSGKTASGMLESKSYSDNETYITINGTEYKFSKYGKDNKGCYSGDNVTAYLTAAGKVMKLEKKALERKLGYIDDVIVSSNEEKIYVRLYTEDGEYLKTECASRVLSDGKLYKKYSDIETLMKKEKNKALADKDLIHYALNDDGQITLIDYPYSYINYEESDEISKRKNDNEDENSLFKNFSGGGKFKKDIMSIGGENYADNNAKVFLIPNNSDYTKYVVKTASSYFSQDKNYSDVRGYGTDVKNIKSCAYLINESAASVPGEMTIASVITGIEYNNVYFNDDIYSQIKYYQSGAKKTAMVEADGDVAKILSKLSVGDFVQLSLDSNGIVLNLEPLYLTSAGKIYDTETAISWGRTKSYVTSGFNSERYVMRSKIKKILGDYIMLENGIMANANSPLYFGQGIYIYDSSEASSQYKVQVGGMNDLAEGTDVMMMTYYGTINGLIVIK